MLGSPEYVREEAKRILGFQFPLLGSLLLSPKCAKEVNFFQFPLLGSLQSKKSNGYYLGLTFNSLCWVHVMIEYLKLDSTFTAFNSLCWVLNNKGAYTYIFIPNFQFPLLGSKLERESKLCSRSRLSIPFVGFRRPAKKGRK